MSSRGGMEAGKRTATSGPESKSRAGKSSKRDIRFRDLVEPALQAKRELKKNEESSIETDRFRLRRVLPIIGHVKISQLTPGRIERFLQELSRGDATHRKLSGASLNRYHSLLSSIFRYAVRQGITRVNPLAAGGVERAKEAKIHIRFLNDAEQHRLSVAIRKQCPEKLLEVELAILSGMRRGEQFNARWDDWKVREGVLCVTGKDRPADGANQSQGATLPHAASSASAKRVALHHAGAQRFAGRSAAVV